jgi:predicted RNA binding protein YcfA (HicA-like mRNA interferase family)
MMMASYFIGVLSLPNSPSQDGWYLARTRGSHRQLKNPRQSGLVTVAGKDGDDIPIRTERSILKQARLSR